MRYIILLSALYLTACESSQQNIALGTLERDRIAHTATVNEVITSLPVSQGSIVSEGTVLVQLDDTIQKAQVAIAQASVDNFEANLEKLRNGARIEEVAAARAKLAGSRASLDETNANYNRTLELAKSSAISAAEKDRILAMREASLANLKAAQEALHILTNGTREEDLRAAEALYNKAKAVLEIEQKKLKDLTIVATRNGILDNLPWNLGERPTIGSPLAIVLAGKAPYARVYIPEAHRVNIKINDELIIHVDGLERNIVGSVRWVSNDPAFTPYYALNQEERSRLMYLAEIQLPETEQNLPSGIPVQVELK